MGRDKLQQLESQVAALTDSAHQREARAAADIAAYQEAYAERVGDLEAQIAALTDAANQREARAAAAIAAHQQAHAERVSNLLAQIAGFAEASSKREIQAAADIAAHRQAYAERVGELEAHVAALTDAASRREAQAAADIAAHQQAYAERVGELEAQIAALTDAANQRELRGTADIAGHLQRYAERVGDLEARIAALTYQANETRARPPAPIEGPAAADIAAQQRAYDAQIADLQVQIAGYQNAYAKRVAELEAQISALTEAAIEREAQVTQKKDFDYQLLMDHQQKLAEYKDLDCDFLAFYERCKPYTMTSVERLFALYKAVEYICTNGIAGDLIECGVWRGGSCMLMALALLQHGSTDRRILMFDTFEGHPMPDAERDVDIWGGRAIDEWQQREAAGTVGEWGFASIDEVRANLLSTGYPPDRIVLVKGMVETTAAENVPKSLAILRLDTDWYDSTRVALDQFYSRLTLGGVLIIDDYGHYKGQKQAVDAYFRKIGQLPLLQRVDYSCRIAIKVFGDRLSVPSSNAYE